MKGHRPRRSSGSRPTRRDGNPPSLAWRGSVRPADEDDGFAPYDADEGFIQLGDGDDWPPHWGAARAGFP